MLKPSFSDVAGPNRNWVRNGQIQELNLSINWHVGRKEQTTTTFLKDFRDPVPALFKSMLLCKDEVIIHMSVHFFMQTCLFSVENPVQGAHKDIAWHRCNTCPNAYSRLLDKELPFPAHICGTQVKHQQLHECATDIPFSFLNNTSSL